MRLGPLEIVIILVVVLVIFGATKMTDVGKRIGGGGKSKSGGRAGSETKAAPIRYPRLQMTGILIVVAGAILLGISYGLLKLVREGDDLVLTSEDHAIIAEVWNSKTVRAHLLENLGPGRLQVHPRMRGHVKQALIRIGFPVEDLAGYVEGDPLPMTLAEQMTPSEFRLLLDRFFKTVFVAVDTYHGVVDHIVGDGVMAMWTPGFGGPDHPVQVVRAGRKLVADMASDPILGKSLPAGVGIHTGVAWVGVVGETGVHDFTVLGDVPNTVARLGSVTAGGELAMSDAIVEVASVDTEGLERRLLDLKGKAEPFPAWIEKAPPEAS